MREAEITRNTNETQITAKWNLDKVAKGNISTGVGFLNHMLTLLEAHSGTCLSLEAKGDTYVDCHHTVEDVGIVLGNLLKNAAGDKKGIKRYGSFTLPMDEALVQVNLDFGGRPYIVFNVDMPKVRLGDYDTEMTEELFRAVAFNAGMTLHVNLVYGSNCHHIIEGIFKAFAHALKEAISVDEKISGVLSTKGVM
ncbi:MAG: imidazoleglycerol-phosphate dehydratase HisB [Ruminococcaceae bacterium]|nr:imidazoleglycerol-phosphate dehydratase HisB [Oscillospiraceae bacterium]